MRLQMDSFIRIFYQLQPTYIGNRKSQVLTSVDLFQFISTIQLNGLIVDKLVNLLLQNSMTFIIG